MASTATDKRPKVTRRMARELQAEQATAATTGALPTQPDKRQTKAALVVDLLARDAGLSLEELCHATTWQAHTSRTFLTGLRKKGRVLERSKREDGTTSYRIAVRASIGAKENSEADA